LKKVYAGLHFERLGNGAWVVSCGLDDFGRTTDTAGFLTYEEAEGHALAYVRRVGLKAKSELEP
jgi:hypothetical protein